ncbi:MAG TPA: ATP-binding protein [Bacteroidaceae bacterium]|nr:ATP-binding protein [Bacteroidaceae bacterium]
MKIRSYFVILTLLITLLFCFIVWAMSQPIKATTVYVGTSLIAILLLTYLSYFYQKVVKPMQTIGNGIELIKEQDFSSRLKNVGQVEADYIVDIFNRMMQQLKDERLRLREQNYFLDLLIAASPMGVIILDFDEQISSMNPVAKEILQASQTENSWGTIQHPLTKYLVKLQTNESQIYRLNTSEIYRCTKQTFVDRGFPHPFILIETLTAEVRKAEKIAYEKVIRMIAHEVNNTVAGVTSTLDTVVNSLSYNENNTEICDVTNICIERCMTMSHFITRFADVVKIPEPQTSETNLNEYIARFDKMIRSYTQPKKIQVSIQLDSQALYAYLDIPLFEGALINIIKNAVESIEDKGHIVISTTVNPPQLILANNGANIPEDIQSQLFSPFFSTKPTGQGIGLLYTREVLEKHHFNFSLHTDDDLWTRFIISFPKQNR